MPTVKACEEARRRTMLARLLRAFPIERGNWEVDCAPMVEPVLAMARGRAPLGGPYVALAADHDYTFVELSRSEAEALEVLAAWACDEEYPKRPLGLADLAAGSLHGVEVTVTRSGRLGPIGAGVQR